MHWHAQLSFPTRDCRSRFFLSFASRAPGVTLVAARPLSDRTVYCIQHDAKEGELLTWTSNFVVVDAEPRSTQSPHQLIKAPSCIILVCRLLQENRPDTQ